MTSLRQYPGLILLAVCIVFHIGWLKFSLPGHGIYVGDYVLRLTVIGLCLWAIWPTLSRPALPAVTPVTAALLLLGPPALIWIDGVLAPQAWAHALDDLLRFNIQWPPIDDPLLHAFDLTVGLALVAISEEFVYRRLYLDWWRSRGGTVIELYLGSSLAFMALHLPQGLFDAGMTFLWGLLLMALYRRTGSLLIPIAVHYGVDLYYFI